MKAGHLNTSKTRFRRTGFSLIEILVVIAIMVILLGMGGWVYSRALVRGRNTATKVLLQRLGQAMLNYKQTGGWGTFPIEPGGNPQVFDTADPGYFSMECAPLGSKPTGTESNKALFEFLKENTNFKAEAFHIRNGELVDNFGRPVVVRFLRKPRSQNDPDGAKDEVVVIWSYGHDGKNQTNAKPAYTYQGPDDYDLDEIERIEASKDSDDIRVWVR